MNYLKQVKWKLVWTYMRIMGLLQSVIYGQGHCPRCKLLHTFNSSFRIACPCGQTWYKRPCCNICETDRNSVIVYGKWVCCKTCGYQPLPGPPLVNPPRSTAPKAE